MHTRQTIVCFQKQIVSFLSKVCLTFKQSDPFHGIQFPTSDLIFVPAGFVSGFRSAVRQTSSLRGPQTRRWHCTRLLSGFIIASIHYHKLEANGVEPVEGMGGGVRSPRRFFCSHLLAEGFCSVFWFRFWSGFITRSLYFFLRGGVEANPQVEQPRPCDSGKGLGRGHQPLQSAELGFG